MEFLVEFDLNVPADASASEVNGRERAEAAAADKLVDEGHLVRLWKPPAGAGESKALGLYRADDKRSSTIFWTPCRFAPGCTSRSPPWRPTPTLPPSPPPVRRP